MRIKGKITVWKDDKGFGFITEDKSNQQIFVHIKAFVNRKRKPMINQRVTYVISKDKQGRPCADKVARSEDELVKKREDDNRQQKRTQKARSSFSALLFLVIVAGSTFLGKTHFLVLLCYFILSAVTFILYAVDKSAAQKGTWRTSEDTLHFFSLIGGWCGAMLAQQIFRHKSQKQSFRFVFWITVLFNVGGFIAWHVYTDAYSLDELSMLLENIKSL